MSQKKVLFVWSICLLVLIFAVNGYGDVITWNNNTGDQDYGNSQNWNANKVPQHNDIVLIGTSTIPISCVEQPILDGDYEATDLYIGHSGNGQMTINDGSFIVTGNVIVGTFGSNTDGILTIKNGALENTGFGFIVGYEGTGRVDILDGSVTVNSLKLAYNGGSGIINIKGGTLTVADEYGMDIQHQPAAPDNLINITDGKLIRNGNRVDELNYLIGLAYIVGYNGLGMLEVDYNSVDGITTVQADCKGCYDYDITDDLIVDNLDIAQLVSCWLEDNTGQCFKGNFNNDCIINNYDFALLARDWTNQRWRYIYNPWWDYVYDIEGRAFSAYELMKKNFCRLGSFDNSFMADPVTWAVGDFTGFYPSGDLAMYQRGQPDYGDCALQMQGTTTGIQLDTLSTPPDEPNPYDLLCGATIYNWWDSYPPYGWRYDTSSIKFKYLLKIPTVYWEGEGKSVPFAYVALALKDRTTDIIIWFCIVNYDPRGNVTEYINWDPGTDMAIVSTCHGPGTEYCSSPQSNSYQTQTWNDWKYFECIITRQNLTKALEDVNNEYGLGISTNPSDYTIFQRSLLAEIYWPNGNAHMGAAYKECYIIEQW